MTGNVKVQELLDKGQGVVTPKYSVCLGLGLQFLIPRRMFCLAVTLWVLLISSHQGLSSLVPRPSDRPVFVFDRLQHTKWRGKTCPFYHVNDAMFIYVDRGGRVSHQKNKLEALSSCFCPKQWFVKLTTYRKDVCTKCIFLIREPSPTSSLVPTPRAPPGEKRSGEQSRISWAYSPKWWKTNEIARSLIIT